MKHTHGQNGSPLTIDEKRRYSRHLILPEFGLEGQQRLKESSVLIVGTGGLGSPLAMYLAAAGVGHLGLVDFDVVEISNLQRQLLYGNSSLGRQKADAAAERIRDLNPHIDVTTHKVRLTSENALELIQAYDVVADGTDNFPTRYLVNDACVITGRPNVYASIFRFDGQVSVFGMPDGPCYRCVYPEPPPPGLVPSCAEGGVLGVLPGLVGTLQATEVIKVLTGIGRSLNGRLLLVDALETTFRTLRLRRDPSCPLCGDNPTQTELIDYEQFCGLTPGGPLGDLAGVPEISVSQLKERMDQGREPYVLDVRQSEEYDISNIGSHLIPLDQLSDRLDDIRAGKDDEVVVICRSGVRSARAVQMLRVAGFRHAFNLAGGILAWSDEIDSSIVKY
jgi:adenylyltransferase/sulfurtransferase